MSETSNKTVEALAALNKQSPINITSESVSATKKPPPESVKDIQIRSLVIFSFWAIVILLGLPVWWWTTSIHRSRLPLREMLEWAEGKVCFHESFRPRLLKLSCIRSTDMQTDISTSNTN